ncbi:MAG: hypothetical protein ACPG7F_08280 [Aggregatilineales bacterium]
MNQQELNALQAKYGEMLMAKANVIGVGIGLVMIEGDYTEAPALVVMVAQKMPLAQLEHADVVPARLDGVRVDVQETGVFSAST